MLSVQSRGKLLLGIGAFVGAAAVTIAWLQSHKANKMSNITQTLDELQQNHIHIKDKQYVEEVIQKLIAGGKDRLQVVADFDMTLSCFTYKGQPCDSCHNCLDRSAYMPGWFREKAIAIRDYYYAIEIDPTRTIEEKYPYMIEWWTKAHDLLLQCNLNRTTIGQIVRESRLRLREGCDWLFQQLDKHNVPLLIFSAGVGDIIEEVIKQQIKMYDNIKIISNYMDFNHQGNLVGFQGELIHVFNKNENAVHKSDYFDKLTHRDNIVLMGDSAGDLKMADGASSVNAILKIGFLNDKIEERLETYKNLFDIVIVSDETVDVANAIFQKII